MRTSAFLGAFQGRLAHALEDTFGVQQKARDRGHCESSCTAAIPRPEGCAPSFVAARKYGGGRMAVYNMFDTLQAYTSAGQCAPACGTGDPSRCMLRELAQHACRWHKVTTRSQGAWAHFSDGELAVTGAVCPVHSSSAPRVRGLGILGKLHCTGWQDQHVVHAGNHLRAGLHAELAALCRRACPARLRGAPPCPGPVRTASATRCARGIDKCAPGPGAPSFPRCAHVFKLAGPPPGPEGRVQRPAEVQARRACTCRSVRDSSCVAGGGVG